MSLGDLERKYGNFYSPRFKIQVGSAELAESDGVISDISVDTTLEGANRFSFTVNEGYDHERRQFSGLCWDRSSTGLEVEISMGYGNRLELMFVGRIHSVRPNFRREGGPTVQIGGYGPLNDMMRGTHSASWENMTDSDVVNDITDEYGFRDRHVDRTRPVRGEIVQNGQSDYEFLTELAARNGFELFARGDVFHFRKPKLDIVPRTSLRYGESLLSFTPELNSVNQVGTVEVRSWDPKRKEEIVGTAGSDAIGADGSKQVLQLPVESREEAERIAEATRDRIAEGVITGSGETLGIPEIRAGETIRLSGLGPEFTRTYYVINAKHGIGSSGYTTSFQVKQRRLDGEGVFN